MITGPQFVEFELDHLRVSALTWGAPDGRLALCLHGFPDSAWSWRHLGPLLAERGFYVVAPFTRGYAPTELPDDGDYHLAALMYDAVALHEHLGAAPDAVLIGHDWGSFTANGLAAQPESPFGEYVTISVPSIDATRQTGQSIAKRLRCTPGQLRMSWYVMFFQLPWLPERVVARIIPKLWRDWSRPTLDIDEDVVNTLGALPTRGHRRAAVSYYRATFRMTRPAPAYAALHGARFGVPLRPVLHIQGGMDGAIQPGWVDGLQSVLPEGSTVTVFEDSGHFTQVEDPERLCSAILDHLDRRRAAAVGSSR